MQMNQQARPHRSMSPLEWSLLIALSILWGGSFFFIGVAVRALPPFTLVTARVALAALVLHVVVLATGQRMPADRREIPGPTPGPPHGWRPSRHRVNTV